MPPYINRWGMSIEVGTNSYVSLADANQHFRNRLHSDAWEFSVHERERALKQACSLLETRVHWHGRKTDESQTLQWPRIGLLDYYGKTLPSDETPATVKAVQCELALYLIENDPHVVPGGVDSIRFAGLNIDARPGNETIPQKIFRPISIYGILIDSSNHRLSR